MPMLVLASGSPRRHHLLAAAGVVFEVVPPRLEEVGLPGELPAEMATRLARQKAHEVAARVEPDRVVLGVDTVVAVGHRVLGKPVDEAEAVEMLLQLSGRTHQVFSGFAIVGPGEEQTGVDETRVTMRSISPDEATAYSATGEPLDKAGAYAIQGGAMRFITSVVGSSTNVMGLPLGVLLPFLAIRGIIPRTGENDAFGVIDP